MAIILTGPNGALAYWNDKQTTPLDPVFGIRGRIKLEAKRSYARLSALAANSNHAPRGCDGAVTSDHGLDLLFSIAGAR
tara:strand:- start:445 stop:681 length:237 start_codon:yes stop_codon:yes gene_type:complete